MTYTKSRADWKDYPDTSTPITQADLDNIEQGIFDAHRIPGLGYLVTRTSSYTAGANDGLILCDATTAGFTITLPTAVGVTGKQYRIKKVDASGNVITIQTTSSQTLDGVAPPIRLGLPNQTAWFESDGANWKIVAPLRMNVSRNGANVGARAVHNFIEGSGIVINAADDATNEKVDITISSSTGATNDTERQRRIQMGYKAWSMSPVIAQNSTIPTDSRVVGTPVWFDAGVPITNAIAFVDQTASGITLAKFAIFSLDGTSRYAVSADSKALLNAQDRIIIPFSSSWTPSVAGFYAMAMIIVKGGGTAPSFRRASISPWTKEAPGAAGNVSISQTAHSYPAAGAGTIVGSFTGAIGSGTTVLVVCTAEATSSGGVSAWTCADSLGNTYTRLVAGYDSTDGQGWAVFYAKNASGGSCTVTVTLDGTRNFRGIELAEYAGADLTAPIDTSSFHSTVQTGGTGANNVSLPAITPATNGCRIVGVVAHTGPGAPTWTAGTSFTLQSSGIAAAGAGGLANEDFVQATAGAITPTITDSVASPKFMGGSIALKPAAGGGSSGGTPWSLISAATGLSDMPSTVTWQGGDSAWLIAAT